MYPTVLALLCGLSAVSAATIAPHSIFARDASNVCSDLSISSNNGNRKVAIVIDSSGSMASSDPYDYRVSAGRALNTFLISNSEASSSQPADLVTVIDFDSESYLDYALGDPGGANSSFNNIHSSGGTYIASGVQMAIDQLTGGGGSTSQRSAIVVFTDGEDESTTELTDAINKATSLGIRVSFGYLAYDTSAQPVQVLSAIRSSNGVYATITVAAGAQNYINYVILNGLTYNDNAQGYSDQLLAGLAETHFISGSDTKNLVYSASAGEVITFYVTSISAGTLTAVATMNGKTLNQTDASYSYGYLYVTAPSAGQIQVAVTASNAPTDSMFSVQTSSNVPIKNCTVGVNPQSAGLSTGAKAGIGVGTVLGAGLLTTAAYFAYKYLHAPNTLAPGHSGPNATSGGPADPNHTSGPQMVDSKDPVNYNAYPVDPSSGAPTTGGAPGGAPHTGPPSLPTGHTGGPMSPTGGSLTGPTGAAPMSVPPVGGPPIAPGGGVSPAAFLPLAAIPPMVMPNNKGVSPKDPNNTGGNPTENHNLNNITPYNPNHTGVQQPLSPNHTGYQNPFSHNTGMPQAQQYPGAQNQQYPISPNHTGSQLPVSPDHTGSQFSSPNSTAGGGDMYNPNHTGGPSLDPSSTQTHQLGPNHTGGGGGMFNPNHIGGGLQQPLGPNHTGGDPSAFSPNHTGGGDFNNPNHTDMQYPNHTDYDPGNCSCGEPSDGEFDGPSGVPFGVVVVGTGRRHKHRKHHHHPHLAPNRACEDQACSLNARDHVCWPREKECACTCRIKGCPARKTGRIVEM